MPKKSTERQTTRRTKVKDLPKEEKALSKEEQAKIKGGVVVNHEEQYSFGDGSVKTSITDGTSNTFTGGVFVGKH